MKTNEKHAFDKATQIMLVEGVRTTWYAAKEYLANGGTLDNIQESERYNFGEGMIYGVAKSMYYYGCAEKDLRECVKLVLRMEFEVTEGKTELFQFICDRIDTFLKP